MAVTLQAETQGGSPDPLVMPFLPTPPFSQFDTDGKRSGFSVDLAEMIGEEIGVPITYLNVPDTASFVDALVSGRAHLFPGIAKLPALTANVFSDTVVTERLQIAVLDERAEETISSGVTNLRLGIVPPALGSDETQVLERNEVIKYANAEAAVMGLLLGSVDALLMPNPVVYSIAKKARADGRIRFTGETIREIDRVVALHESRRDLLAAVNKAIATFEKDGRLEALKQRYGVVTPAPPTDVLTVGIFDLEPYMSLNDERNAEGFAVDVLKDLAAIIGQPIAFTPIQMQDLTPGTSHDIIPAITRTPEREEIMDFVYPVEISEFSIFVRSGEETDVGSLSDLTAHRVGVFSVSVAKKFAVEAGVNNLIEFSDGYSTADMLKALHRQDIDAMLFERTSTRAEINALALTSDIVEIEPPFFSSERAPALRFGLGSFRDKLNSVIPGYLVSDRYFTLRQQYFGEPVFWTKSRIYMLLGLTSALLVSMLMYLGLQKYRQRQQAFARQQHELDVERAYNTELGKLVEQLELTNREQAEFTYAVSHDLKSPSNTIEMLIEEMAEQEWMQQEGQSLLRDMSATNQRMRVLVDDVLVYSKIVEDKDKSESQVVDLNDVISAVQVDLAADILATNAVIDVEPLPMMFGHETQLKILLQNLIANSIKFCPPERTPKITVTTTIQQTTIQIIVADNGIGIAEAHRERVFSLFQRLHTHSEYEGTGLGLTICKRIVTIHHGQIAIGSSVNGGTAITLTFPREFNEKTDQSSTID